MANHGADRSISYIVLPIASKKRMYLGIAWVLVVWLNTSSILFVLSLLCWIMLCSYCRSLLFGLNIIVMLLIMFYHWSLHQVVNHCPNIPSVDPYMPLWRYWWLYPFWGIPIIVPTWLYTKHDLLLYTMFNYDTRYRSICKPIYIIVYPTYINLLMYIYMYIVQPKNQYKLVIDGDIPLDVGCFQRS